jgi:hypothetical protein
MQAGWGIKMQMVDTSVAGDSSVAEILSGSRAILWVQVKPM